MQFVCIISQSSISRIDKKHCRDSIDIMAFGRIVPLILTPLLLLYHFSEGFNLRENQSI